MRQTYGAPSEVRAWVSMRKKPLSRARSLGPSPGEGATRLIEHCARGRDSHPGHSAPTPPAAAPACEPRPRALTEAHHLAVAKLAARRPSHQGVAASHGARVNAPCERPDPASPAVVVLHAAEIALRTQAGLGVAVGAQGVGVGDHRVERRDPRRRSSIIPRHRREGAAARAALHRPNDERRLAQRPAPSAVSASCSSSTPSRRGSSRSHSCARSARRSPPRQRRSGRSPRA